MTINTKVKINIGMFKSKIGSVVGYKEYETLIFKDTLITVLLENGKKVHCEKTILNTI